MHSGHCGVNPGSYRIKDDVDIVSAMATPVPEENQERRKLYVKGRKVKTADRRRGRNDPAD